MKYAITVLAILLSVMPASGSDHHFPRSTTQKIAQMAVGASQARILFFGDSMATIGNAGFPHQLTLLMERYGAIGSGPFPTISAAGSSYAGDSTASSNPADYTRWPTGGIPWVETGGTITYGRGGSGAVADLLRVFYIKEPGAGEIKVQSSTDGTNWTDESGTLDADAGSMSLGIFTTTKTIGRYLVRVVGLSGRVYVLPAACGQFSATTASGVEVMNVAIGGLSLTNANLSNAGVWSEWIEEVQPDILMFEMKEGEASIAGDVLDLQDRTITAAPLLDWCYILSTPLESNDASQIAQNELVRTIAELGGDCILDFYSLFGTYDAGYARGFYSDGVHRSQLGNQVLVGYTINKLNLMAGVGAKLANDLVALHAKVSDLAFYASSEIAKADARAIAAFAPSNGNADFRVTLNRFMEFADSNGVVQASLNPSGLNNQSVPIFHLPRVISLGNQGDTFLSRNSGNVVRVGGNSVGTGTLGVFYGNIWGNESGTAASPSLSFQNFQNRGFFPFTGSVGVSVGGSRVGYWNSGGYTSDGFLAPSNSEATWTAGSGSPEGVKTAKVGSLYTRTDGGATTTLYVKESGTGNTGWVAK